MLRDQVKVLTKKREFVNRLSIVLPFYNEEHTVFDLLTELVSISKSCCHELEIICVDDGSNDKTVNELLLFREENKSIKVLVFSRNFGQDAAITAGIDHATGDVLVIMDSDLQHPPKLIPKMIDHWKNGYDVVCMVRENRDSESLLTRMIKNIYYRVLTKISNCEMVPNTGNFRLLDKEAYSSLKNLSEKSRYLYGLYQWIGYPTVYIKYSAEIRRSGESKWHLFSLINKALSGIISFSTVPLRFWSVLGASVAVFSFLYGVYIVIKTMVFGIALPGFATIATLILFIGGLQLFSIGVIGEYLASLFLEAKNRPIYLIYKSYGMSVSDKKTHE